LISTDLKDKYDLVSLAGVTKDLVENDPASSEIILKQIEISQRLHGTQEVILIHHMDCGAYGGHQAFENLPAEHDKQVQGLALAKKIINEKFPKLEVKKILARIQEKNGENQIDFEALD